MSAFALYGFSCFSGRLPALWCSDAPVAGLCPAFVFAPKSARNFTCHRCDAFFVFFVDIHPFSRKYPVEDQVLDLVGDQFVSHGRKIQLAKVDIPKQALALFSGFSGDVVGVALVFSFEPGWVFRHVDVDPLFVVVEKDTEGRFGHFSQPFKLNSSAIIYPIFLVWKFFNVKKSANLIIPGGFLPGWILMVRDVGKA